MTNLTMDATPALRPVLAKSLAEANVAGMGWLVQHTHAHGNGNTQPFPGVQRMPHAEEDTPGQEGEDNVGRSGPA